MNALKLRTWLILPSSPVSWAGVNHYASAAAGTIIGKSTAAAIAISMAGSVSMLFQNSETKLPSGIGSHNPYLRES